ncbi:MAG: dihydrodipicolinate synthase family protein [Acidobacteriota bacterium]|nr:dihydrodipicolinate synthase family protein [Acidobacteriota bacterium]
MLLNGILPAITTPFYSDGRLYLKKLEHNADRLTRGPINGLVVLGSTGEAVFLTCEEQREVLRTAIAAAAAEKVMVAGCGHESVQETLAACEFAAAVGYDVALVRTPHYYKAQMSAPAMLNYYRTVADRSPLPVLMYSYPQCTGYDLPLELIAELAQHPNILGIKESSGDLAKVEKMVQLTREVKREVRVTHEFQPATGRMMQKAQAAPVGEFVSAGALAATAQKPSSAAVEVIGELKLRRKEVGFQVLVGTGQKFYPLLKAGAVGGVLAFAAAAPTACYEIYAAFKDNDHALAAEKQQRITGACQRIVGELGIAGLKYACDLNGFAGGNPRLPLLPLTGEQRQEVEALMEDIRS